MNLDLAFNAIQSWYNVTGMIDFTHAGLRKVRFGLTLTSMDINDDKWLIALADYF